MKKLLTWKTKYSTPIRNELICPKNLFYLDPWSYDLSYGEKTTKFSELANKNNISRVHDGLGMLFQQAALSFKIWTDLKPNVEEAMKVFRI